ncbi:MAG: hypothetical protein AB7G93_21585 [Bdellovibrionales bacterium]
MIPHIISLFTLLGTWQYVGFHYQDHFYPNPNPELVVRFTFKEDQISHLIWYRKNEPGFCERTAAFSLENDLLLQKIIWVNPENEGHCAQDPDMQLGRESTTQVRLSEGELGFVLDINGSELVYLLRRSR